MNLLINTVVSSLHRSHLRCDKNRNTYPDSKRDQTYNQSGYLALLHKIPLSKLIALDVPLHDVGFSVLVAVAVGTILDVHSIRVNLVDLLGLVCIVVCVEVVPEVVGLQSCCVDLTIVLVNVFPPELVGILHVVVVSYGKIRVF